MRREGAAGAAGAPRPVAGALVAVAPLVGAAAPEAVVGVAVAAVAAPAGASRLDVVEAAASQPADRAAEVAHRQ
jgi:hypothetical protein